MGKLKRASLCAIILPVFFFCLCVFSVTRSENIQIELAVDTANTDQDGLLVLYGSVHSGGEIGLPIAAGDINGDGKADVVFCEMYASVGGPRVNNGQVNFFLSDGRDSGFVDAAAGPANVSTLLGASSGDLLGTSVAVGDVNGDGFADVAAAAALSDGPGGSRFNCGAAYIVPGSRTFNLHADLSTADGVPPAGITVIYGPKANARFGIWIDTGDVDGDGIGDIVVGADQLDSDAGPHVGGAYIIFGSRNLPKVIDLAAPPAGVRVSRVLGATQEDHWGAALHVGDINNDGIADLVIGASIYRDSASYVSPSDQSDGHDARGAGNGGARLYCGEVFVIYGSRTWPAEIDLRHPPSNSTHVIGAQSFDLAGSQLFSADVNGDGKNDLIVGALRANAPDSTIGRTGAVYVIYGSAQLQGATIDLASPDTSGLRVSAIYGESNLDCAGDSVRSYDINKDGMSDLFIGSPEHTFSINGEEREDAGDTKIIFGQHDFLPSVVKLYEPPPGIKVFRLAGGHGQDQGLAGGDEFSYRLTGGDVDGDGYPDYIANAMHGDGFGMLLPNAGNVYVFSGKKLSMKLGFLATPAPVIASAALAFNGQPVQQAAAGQSGLRITITGDGFRTDTAITINGIAVVSRSTTDPRRITVDLDENPAVKNSVGALVIRAHNTSPLSELSNAVTAGTLTGPEITSAKVKRKASGVLLLIIFGANFTDNSNVTVVDQGGQAVPVRTVGFVASDNLRVKLGGDVQSGGSVRFRVVTQTGVLSNEAVANVP